MNATDPTLATILQTQGNLEHYHVPKYQREYTWGHNEWELLIDDIEENPPGYFMGSIICIDDNEELGPGESRIYEVVDGQQRLTTLSILLMAIYKRFQDMKSELNDLDEETREDFNHKINSIRKQLVYKKNAVNKGEQGYVKEKEKYCFLRVQPSSQGLNRNDYLYTLNRLGLIIGDYTAKHYGLRRIAKAFDFYSNRIPGSLSELDELLDKINSLRFIHITVSSSADAFTLFESLNNRGVPLSVIDILKNKMLANLEKKHQFNIDEAYEEWQELLRCLPEYNDQERFLRHYYNAFKVNPERRIERFTKATKSNLVQIYETYIKGNSKAIFEDLLEKGKTYNNLIDPEIKPDNKQNQLLLDLKRIGSAAAYLLLLYLYSLKEQHFTHKDAVMEEVLEVLVKYYLRRNVTDFPNTRDLDAINIEVIEICQQVIDRGEKLESSIIIDTLLTQKGRPAPINLLKEKLADSLFYNNSGMARYVLAKLDELSHSKEYNTDLWQRNAKGLLVWTVEHIFPQNENIPDCWVQMMADGNREKAKEIQSKWVHCLGNLTLSGYNSQLSDACFGKKQDLQENRKFLGYSINIGYKNRLSLNTLKFSYKGQMTNLSEAPEWNAETIEARNNAMVDILLRRFAFNQDELKSLEGENE